LWIDDGSGTVTTGGSTTGIDLSGNCPATNAVGKDVRVLGSVCWADNPVSCGDLIGGADLSNINSVISCYNDNTINPTAGVLFGSDQVYETAIPIDKVVGSYIVLQFTDGSYLRLTPFTAGNAAGLV